MALQVCSLPGCWTMTAGKLPEGGAPLGSKLEPAPFAEEATGQTNNLGICNLHP